MTKIGHQCLKVLKSDIHVNNRTLVSGIGLKCLNTDIIVTCDKNWARVTEIGHWCPKSDTLCLKSDTSI